ncbi:hypothetical protein FHL15_010991 [Xylaria flabelliformis]|uniref:Uncharacterized protein n=1 Tax=Xylaria flabelliformis TaxID=2512241 RepID=A0A553HJJ6_9PEZI|nr:hypothetical protein FHL15_010991 [Xylaria flabelliformis]
MCFEVDITYACGHWDTEVTPCKHRGNKTRCQIRKLWPRIYTQYCRPACPGVSVRSPAPQYGWKLMTSTLLPISEYPYTAVKQSRRALRARHKSIYRMRSYRITTSVVSSRDARHDAQTSHAQVSGAPVADASDSALGIEPSVPSRGQTNQCLLTRWQPFRPTFCRGTPSKVAGGNKEAESPAYQHGLMVPEAQMYEEGQQPLPNLVNQHSQYHVKAVKEVDGAKDSGNQAASVPYNPYMMDGYASDTSETIANDSNLEDDDGGAEHDINGANGAMDTTTHDNNYSGGRVAADNSLPIDKEGRFRLGSQWQVPSSHIAQSDASSEYSEASIWSEPTRDIIAPPPTPELDTAVPDQVMADRPQAVDLANLCRPHGRITGSSGYESRTQHRLTAAPLTAALNCHNYSTSDSENSDDDIVIIPDPKGGLNGKGTQKYHGRHQAVSATPAAAKRYDADFEIDDDGCFVLKECLDQDGL